jgi:hypothetical protein
MVTQPLVAGALLLGIVVLTGANADQREKERRISMKRFLYAGGFLQATAMIGLAAAFITLVEATDRDGIQPAATGSQALPAAQTFPANASSSQEPVSAMFGDERRAQAAQEDDILSTTGSSTSGEYVAFGWGSYTLRLLFPWA